MQRHLLGHCYGILSLWHFELGLLEAYRYSGPDFNQKPKKTNQDG